MGGDTEDDLEEFDVKVLGEGREEDTEPLGKESQGKEEQIQRVQLMLKTREQ